MLKKINMSKIINNHGDEFLKYLNSLVNDGIQNEGEELTPGIYITGLNAESFIRDKIINQYDSFSNEDDYRSNYGVCDNHTQILNEYPELEGCADRNFVVLMTPISKSDQPEKDGWRWHKWGPYIGEHQITTEYLFDEPVVEMVYVYHIYEVV